MTHSNGVWTSSERDRLQSRAHNLVDKAIGKGLLIPPQQLQCVDCDNPAWCYDHRDYRKPLAVQPVCQGCNNRRGAALPAIGSQDGRYSKRHTKEELPTVGHLWSNLGGGEGYSPLESVCHIDVNAFESWWIEEGRMSNGYDPAAYGTRARAIVDRWQYFKRHDPYRLPDIWETA